MAEVKSPTTRVVTGVVRFSYLNAFEPRAAQEGGTKKYSVSLIIPKTDKVTLNKVKAAIEAAKQAGISKLGGKIPPNLKTPLRDGDTERPDDENYANAYFINASSSQKPGVVDADLQPILNTTEIYSGSYGKADINFYAFNTSGSKGIACGLNNLQKVKDGEPLGGRMSAEAAFGGEDDLM